MNTHTPHLKPSLCPQSPSTTLSTLGEIVTPYTSSLGIPPATSSYKERIQSFFDYYTRPANNGIDASINYLLDKYKGQEEDVIAALVERYGAEPVGCTAGLNRASRGKSNSVRSSSNSTNNKIHNDNNTPIPSKHYSSKYSIDRKKSSHNNSNYRNNTPVTRATSPLGKSISTASVATLSPRQGVTFSEVHRYYLAGTSSNSTMGYSSSVATPSSALIQTPTYPLYTTSGGSHQLSLEKLRLQINRQEDTIEKLTRTRDDVQQKTDIFEGQQIEKIKENITILTEMKIDKEKLKNGINPHTVPQAWVTDIMSEMDGVNKELGKIILLRRALEETLKRHLQVCPSSPIRSFLMTDGGEKGRVLCAMLDDC